MTKLISVIVPVYNAEKYLERCINSVCNQSYKHLEIILVNDGSSDNSKSICERLKNEDSRIILINQKNCGSSIARNSGLEIASGDIISFVDSDDFIDSSMLEIMVQLMTKHNLEVVEIERNALSDAKVFDNSFKIEDKPTSFERIIKTTSFQVWKRIYKRSVVEKMRFIPHIIHQDVFFTMDVVNKVSQIGFLNSPLYIYNRESIGIIRSNYSAMKRDIAVKATEYIKTSIPKTQKLKKIFNNYVVHYYTDHYFLISRNTEYDTDGTHRVNLKNEITKAANISNLSLRSLLVILLPAKIIELISSRNQTVGRSETKSH